MKIYDNNIEKSYDSWADQYDTNSNKTRNLDAKATSETLANYDYKHVLELGCGTGKNTHFLLKKASSIIGIDFSLGMLSKAKEKIEDHRVKFMHADLNESWDIEQQTIDLVTSSLTLEHIKDFAHIFDQARQVLHDKGLFFISELHPFKQYKGSKARFETENGLVELDVFIHHVSEYLHHAKEKGFDLVELKEWFDEDEANEIPRLISFVFMKAY